MVITDLNNGDMFKIKRVTLPGEIGKRLADMGFSKNVEGKVVRSALFGDPIQVKIMGYNISIRKSEASGVAVELITNQKKDK
jgi:Fe2+ transport system protein FeoA